MCPGGAGRPGCSASAVVRCGPAQARRGSESKGDSEWRAARGDPGPAGGGKGRARGIPSQDPSPPESDPLQAQERILWDPKIGILT